MENELLNRLLLSCFSLTHAHHCFLLFFYHSIINISTTDYVLARTFSSCMCSVCCLFSIGQFKVMCFSGDLRGLAYIGMTL